MMKCPSFNQKSILKRTSFRAGLYLRPVAMIMCQSSSTAVKHSYQRWKTTPQPILAESNNHGWAPLILIRHISHHAFPIDIT